MNHNRELAGATLAHLEALGVRHIIVCAGARNAPLVTSLLATAEQSYWETYHHFDERTAVFFAMGLSKKSREPAAVVTTSGTAVAEMLPATIEAYYSGIPLVLVTADRPSSYRGSGAPQAIEQTGIFGPYAPIAIDVQSVNDLRGVYDWRQDEPLHLNVCFEEPAADDVVTTWKKQEQLDPTSETTSDSYFFDPEGCIVLLGELQEEWQKPVEDFLVQSGCLIWAEATSGLRESARLAKQLVPSERQVSTLNPNLVLRVGGVPSLRFWRDLEDREEIPVISVSPRPFSGLARTSQLVVIDSFSRWSEVFRPFPEGDGNALPSQEGLKASLQQCLSDHPQSEPALMRGLSENIPSDAVVFLGNSLPIREWNLAASWESPHPRCYASRGANGIDGQVATFLGLGKDEKESWGIFGDLTALYDLNAPALLSDLPSSRRRIVVMNNGGGKIFSRLPSLAGLSEDEKVVTENHHSHDFAPWATMWGMNYYCWTGREPFPTLSESTCLIEIRPSCEETEAFWKDWV